MAALMIAGRGNAYADWDQYPTYEAFENMMFQFAIDHPDKCEIIELGTLPSNRKLLVAHINNGSGEGKPRFFYVSTMHGDETTGWMLMLRLIDYILENPDLPECANVLNNIDLYICPNMNPDGTYHGGNNYVNGATRANANGVDLNRNFPDPHGKLHPDGNEYQPETQWIMQFAQDLQFTMAAIFHGGAEVMNNPWNSTYTLHADDAWFQLLGHEYADLAHIVNPDYMTDYDNGVTNGAQWYMIEGGLQDYLNGYAHCRAFHIECSNTKCPNASQLPNFWNLNKNSLFALMNQCLYGIHGTIVDAESAPKRASRTRRALIGGATITLVGHDDQYSVVTSHLLYGDFHRPVKAGTYTVRVSKPGYEPIDTVVTVNDYETVILNVQLVRLEGITAIIDIDVAEVMTGGTVHFTDESWGAQIVSWDWEFEGGTPATSTDQNPKVTYSQAGTYDVRLTVTNADGETDTKYMPGLIHVVNAFNMHAGQENVDDALFYDDGGPNGNYANNQDYTLTIYPKTKGDDIMVEFQEFETEKGYDFLYIYDGTSTDATLIGSYSGTGTEGPGMISATNKDGALTFRFTSDSSVNKSGWKAHVYTLGRESYPYTGISTIPDNTQPNVWYMLDGRRVLNIKPAAKELPKGIYINNGRKVLIE